MEHPIDPWSNLHDLALLYLFMAHATDAQLDPAERETMIERLATWQSVVDGKELTQVIDEAMLIYVGPHSHDMLNTAMVSLKESMGVAERISVLNDLAALATADGILVPGEVGFIQDLAQYWEIEGELRHQFPPGTHSGSA